MKINILTNGTLLLKYCTTTRDVHELTTVSVGDVEPSLARLEGTVYDKT